MQGLWIFGNKFTCNNSYLNSFRLCVSCFTADNLTLYPVDFRVLQAAQSFGFFLWQVLFLLCRSSLISILQIKIFRILILKRQKLSLISLLLPFSQVFAKCNFRLPIPDWGSSFTAASQGLKSESPQLLLVSDVVDDLSVTVVTLGFLDGTTVVVTSAVSDGSSSNLTWTSPPKSPRRTEGLMSFLAFLEAGGWGIKYWSLSLFLSSRNQIECNLYIETDFSWPQPEQTLCGEAITAAQCPVR